MDEVHKILLKDFDNNTLLPITRGELVLDSSGNQAFRSDAFLATDSLNGLLSSIEKQLIAQLKSDMSNLKSNFYESITKTVKVSLTPDWTPSGLVLDTTFTNGTYAIQIVSGTLLFSGVMSVYVGKMDVEDEIVLHACGEVGNINRIYAKIAPSKTRDYGEIYLATSGDQTVETTLSIAIKKLI